MPLNQALVGGWTLQQWSIENKQGPARDPFGENPEGLLIYTAEGWMSVAICRSDRSLMEPGISPRRQGQARLAEAFRSYFHYSGRYHVRGSDVHHTVTHSLNPDVVGKVLTRAVTLDGDTLLLVATEPDARCHRLHWRRAHP